MTYPDDPRLAEAKQKGMVWVLQQLQIDDLKPSGRELVGPCPRCGGDDRFSVNPGKNQFLCRKCESDGGKGDCIALVMFVRCLTFREALTWLCGPAQEISDAERQLRAAVAETSEKQRQADEARRRSVAIREAQVIWQAGLPPEDTPVRAYLTLRGIGRAALPRLPACLRFHRSLPYMVKQGGEWLEVYRGPAMLAAIQNVAGRFSAVHRTWLDLREPKGKIRLSHAGTTLAAKKGWGSKKGGAIRLQTPPGADTLIMGEGIETTLTPLAVGAGAGAAFWAGIDLGNMSGRQLSGPGLRYAGLPDLSDGLAFVPPVWVRRLIFIQDGDSEPHETASRMRAGLRRAMALRPGLRGQVVCCPPGSDLNDVLLGVGSMAGDISDG